MNSGDLRGSFEYGSGERGLLLLHGYTGTPYEMRPAGEFFAERGFLTYCPRLSGHGTVEGDLNSCTFYDWINSVEEAYLYLRGRCSQVYVMGLSMGGLLALKLAQLHKEIKRVVILAAPLFLTGWNGLFVNACRIGLFRSLVGSVKKPEPEDSRYREIWQKNPSYRRVPTRSSYEFYRLMRDVREGLKDVDQDLMLIYSKDDRDVDFGNLALLLSLLSSSRVLLLLPKNMGHLMTLEDGNQEMFMAIYDFLTR